jgi:6-pyruvoyltetrahydropterin/6-carboxytetrahydropterin synthase
LEAATLDANEMVCDFKLVKELVGDAVQRFDHALCMNTADPAYPEFRARYGERIIGFENRDPTTEVLAEYLFRVLTDAASAYSTERTARGTDTDPIGYALRPEVRVVSVRVWETSSSWAEYCES